MIRIFVLLSACFILHIGAQRVEVMEGDSFTLRTGLTEIQGDNEIEWTFGPERTRIIRMAAGNVTMYGDVRFRDRLQLERHTGDLTIANLSKEHNGIYRLSIIIKNKEKTKEFTVSVYAPLFAPVITKYSLQDSSSSSTCVLLCSVVNVSHVTLSWLKGNRLLSNISTFTPSISLSIPLEVDDQDNNTYSCVIHNPISNLTTHLNINDFCYPVNGCDSAQAVIRLVVTALMGVAAVAAIVVLVYDIRSRTGGKRTDISSRRQRNRVL